MKDLAEIVEALTEDPTLLDDISKKEVEALYFSISFYLQDREIDDLDF